jgi:serine phosphatase RsbU (regulator of sigma subunit)
LIQVTKVIILFFLLSGCNWAYAQKDSLVSVFFSDASSKVKILSLEAILSETYYYEKPDSAMYFANQLVILGKELNNAEAEANGHYFKGYLFYSKADYSQSLEQYTIARKIYNALNDKNGISKTLNGTASIYADQMQSEFAVKYYLECLDLYNETEDKKGRYEIYNNIGNVYAYQGIYNENLDLQKRYYDTALTYYSKTKIIAEELNDQAGLAGYYMNAGNILIMKGDLTNSEINYKKCLEIYLEIEGKQGISLAYHNIGNLELELKNYILAEENFIKSLEISKKANFTYDIYTTTSAMYEMYKSTGNYEKALETFEMYKAVEDSIENQDNKNAYIKEKYKYEYELKADADSIVRQEEIKVNEAEKARSNAEAEKRKSQITFLIIGLMLAGIFWFIIYKRLRITQKQKRIIDLQKEAVEKQKGKIQNQHNLLEESHKSISDSIKYAERLQLAILPSKQDLNNNLGNGFVLFKPKDVVSGDFYWMQKVGDVVLFAAADCTGHGVPGAMVSVVCSNALNRSVKEFGLLNPAEILNKTREIVIETFSRSGEDVKDGMDISLCAIHKEYISFAGANNPLWVVQESSKPIGEEFNKAKMVEKNGFKLLEITGNKQPIGRYERQVDFTQVTLPISKGMSIYLFTDGYADQFGGPRGKKLKYGPFKKAILDLQGQKMSDQKEKLENIFNDWSADLEQVDDVCVIGVKF